MSHAIWSSPVSQSHLPQRPITREEWEEDWARREDWLELVNGILTLSPRENGLNMRAARRLSEALAAVLGEGWERFTHMALRLTPHPGATIRFPDLTVVRPIGLIDTDELDAADVALVVEVLSPSTHRTDLTDKRREYASADIPAYVIIDRERAPRLRLLTDPADGDYRTERSGETVTLRIASHDIVVNASDIIR